MTTIDITSAVIQREYVHLDGALTREFRIVPPTGEPFILVATESLDAKGRQVLIGVAAGGKADERVSAPSFKAPPEQPPKRASTPFQVKRKARLKALAALADRAWRGEYAYYELTAADRQERRRRDMAGRRWTIHEVAYLAHSGWIARLSCTWPRPRLDADGSEVRDHVVFCPHGYTVRNLTFGLPRDLPAEAAYTLGQAVAAGPGRHGDRSQRVKARGRDKPAPTLNEVLASVVDGFATRDDAKMVFDHLAQDYKATKTEIRMPDWPGQTAAPVEGLEVVETCPLPDQETLHRSGEYQLVRFRTGQGWRWVALLVGADNGLPVVASRSREVAVFRTGDLAADLGRLLALGSHDDPYVFDETWARSHFTRNREDCQRQRHNRERYARAFTLRRVALRPDGGAAVLVEARWSVQDPMLPDQERPLANVVVAEPDGFTAVDLKPDGNEAVYNGMLGQRDEHSVDMPALVRRLVAERRPEDRKALERFLCRTSAGLPSLADAEQAWAAVVAAWNGAETIEIEDDALVLTAKQ